MVMKYLAMYEFIRAGTGLPYSCKAPVSGSGRTSASDFSGGVGVSLLRICGGCGLPDMIVRAASLSLASLYCLRSAVLELSRAFGDDREDANCFAAHTVTTGQAHDPAGAFGGVNET